jgi:NADH-quinone oxidoreductase subunit M
VLTAFLAPLGVLISWRTIVARTKEFYLLLLLQQTAMLGIFVALDLMLYYAFWEMSLIPMALLIGMFGRKNGRAAAIKFFLYAFIPSALLLVAMIWIYTQSGTFDFAALQSMRAAGVFPLSARAAMLCALAFLVAFAVKVPVFPLHGWLADAVSEAPTAAVIVLAGKLGLYSILRFSFSLFPAESHRFAPTMVMLGMIAILYGALVALVQTDLKRLAAYATLSGLGFCVLGIFSFTTASIDGGTYQILNEMISGSALFLLLGVLYDRYGTYDIAAYGGIARRLPFWSALITITALSLIGLPILNGFVGEFLVLSGSFGPHRAVATAATVGIILSACYLLNMLRRVLYGESRGITASTPALDLSLREHLAIWPTIVLIALLGICSPYWMRAIDQDAGSRFSTPTSATAPAPPAAAQDSTLEAAH